MPLYTNKALTNVAVARASQTYVAGLVAPILKVQQQSGELYIVDPNNDDLRELDTARAKGGLPNAAFRADPTTTTYRATDHALEGFVADEDRKNADVAVRAEINTTESVTDRIMLKRERTLVAKVGTIAQTSSPGTKWGADAGDPIGELKAKLGVIQGATGKRPNAILIGSHILDAITEIASWQDRTKYTMTIDTQRQMGPANILASHLSIPAANVIIADNWVNTAQEGAAANLVRIWGDNVLLFYKEPGVGYSLRTQTFAAHVVWLGEPGSEEGFLVETKRVPERKGDAIYVHNYYDQKILNAAAAWWFTSVL